MALSAALEALVKELEKTDPAGAQAQRALLEKNDNLAKHLEGGVLRQSDYDRKMNEVKDKVGKVDEYQSWIDRNVPKHENLVKDYNALQAKYADLEKKVQEGAVAAAAAHATEGGEIDPDKLAAAVREKLGGEIPTKAELAKLIKDEATAQASEQLKAAEKRFFEETVPKSLKFQSNYTKAIQRYYNETKEELDDEKFSKFMMEGKYDDPLKALDAFLSPVREEKRIAAEVDKRLKDAMAERGGDFPGSSGSPQPMGALQIRLTKRAEGDPLIPKDAELGDSSLAVAAAAELRSEGRI